MITRYSFGPGWGLLDPSPFAMKAEMLLKMGLLRRPKHIAYAPRSLKQAKPG